jgi:uncharacterized UPF0160 family protein
MPEWPNGADSKSVGLVPTKVRILLPAFNKMKIVATHDGSFHADEVFAIAILKMVYPKIKIIRTRDPKEYSKANYLVDIGLKYNPKKGYFDHHQKEGAGKRKNQVPYSSAGLVWKHFGLKITKDKGIFERIDKRMIQSVDVEDNGVQIKCHVGNFVPYTINAVIATFRLSVKNKKFEDSFNKAVNFAKELLEREISYLTNANKEKKIVEKLIKKSKNKEYLVLPKQYAWQMAIDKYLELKFVVYPYSKDLWAAKTIPKKGAIFEYRKLFPKQWAGLKKEQFEIKSHVKGAEFCHNKRFVMFAKTKKAIIKLIELALKS